MSTLKRLSFLSVTPGVAPIPATPGYWVEVADPPLPPLTQKVITSAFPWATSAAATVGIPSSGSSVGKSPTEGGSAGGAADYYTATSLNGTPGAFVVIANPDGTYKVIRV